MRITIELVEGSAVRDPSLVETVGRVVAIVDNTFGGQRRDTVIVDLDDDVLRKGLAEKRGAF